MPRSIRFLTGALACFTVTIVLGSTASATAAGGNPIKPSQKNYVSNGDYGIRSDDFGSSTWLNNNGERGFKIIKSTARGHKVTAYPNIFRGWQWGIGTNGNWPIRVSADNMPRADLTVRQTWKGTYDASLDIWFSTYPNKTTQANGAEIMIWLSHPNVAAGGTKVRIDEIMAGEGGSTMAAVGARGARPAGSGLGPRWNRRVTAASAWLTVAGLGPGGNQVPLQAVTAPPAPTRSVNASP